MARRVTIIISSIFGIIDSNFITTTKKEKKKKNEQTRNYGKNKRSLQRFSKR